MVKIEKYDVLQIDYKNGDGWLDYCGLKNDTEILQAERYVKGDSLPGFTKPRDQYGLRIIRGGRQEVILSETPKGWDKV